jgi:hypothetical protein
MGNESVEENHNSTQYESSPEKQEDPERNRMVPEQGQTFDQQTQNQKKSGHPYMLNIQRFIRAYSAHHRNLTSSESIDIVNNLNTPDCDGGGGTIALPLKHCG